MSKLVKTTVLSLTLLAGVAAAAHAQSNIAALPPGAAAAPVVAPVGPAAPQYVGPAPGQGWYAKEQQTGAAMQPSPEWVGPKAGSGWYAKEQQSQVVVPSPAWIGPRAN